MTAISIGPVALPVLPLLWLAALWLAQAVAGWRAGAAAAGAAGSDVSAHAAGGDGRVDAAARAAGGDAVGQAFWWAGAAGLLAARLVWVGLAWPAYAEAPWTVLDLRDGGWHAPAGVAALLTALALIAWRRSAWRGPIAWGTMAGALLWTGGVLGLGVYRAPPLPAIMLESADGHRADLRTLARGQPTVINLWASWCAPCRTEMPVLAAAQARHPDVRFLFVNQGEADAPIARYLAGQPFRLQGVWRDPSSALGPAIGSTGLPTTLFVDAEGRVLARHFGPLSAGSLAGRLAALGVAPGPSSAPPLAGH